MVSLVERVVGISDDSNMFNGGYGFLNGFVDGVLLPLNVGMSLSDRDLFEGRSLAGDGYGIVSENHGSNYNMGGVLGISFDLILLGLFYCCFRK